MAVATKSFEEVEVTTVTKVANIVLTLTVEEAHSIRHLLYSGVGARTVGTLGLREVSEQLSNVVAPAPSTHGHFDKIASLASDTRAFERERRVRESKELY